MRRHEIRKRVTAARELQTERFKTLENLPSGRQVVHYNAQMNTKQIRAYCKLDDPSKALLKNAMERLNLCARAYDRILKLRGPLPIWKIRQRYQETISVKLYNTGPWIERNGWGWNTIPLDLEHRS